MNKFKETHNEYPILEIIKNRWSPRAFTKRAVNEEDMHSLFEAARWSASSSNEQPWQYIYAYSGTDGFEQIWNCLVPGNQPWTKDAAVLVIAMARKTFEHNGKENNCATHDLGLANSNMLLQAISMGIFTHPMAGFDKNKVMETFNVSDDLMPVCAIAIGYMGDAERLDEPYKSREFADRKRKTIEEFIKKV
ncbi:MAG: nitroreductase family protein [Taibaiella sp.]|nr:nitroreductase family protein [Taibaiella sp.]